ncbi:MAG: cupin domain-containing protein [Lysobacter sp.]
MSQPRIVHNADTAEYYFEERCHVIEWLNSPDDADVSIAHIRVEPGVTTRLHRLRGTVERYVILQGRGWVELGDNAPVEIGPGDVAVIPSGVAQRIANRSDADLIFLAICTPRFVPECYDDIDPEAA